jgi:steroid 5-alpha reductase family enzyme
VIAALLVNFAILLGAMLLLWLVAARIRDVSFIDAVWGLGMAALAILSWVRMGAPGTRAGLIAAMAALWGVRLGLHLFVRWRRGGEDPRYAKILGKAKDEGRYASAALTRVFGPQAVLLFVTCLPAQLGVFGSPAPAPLGALALAGLGLWAVGMLFETVGDWQLSRFRADPANKGRVLDSGLWRDTRHPNYFGEACVWWGIWLASAEAGWGLALGGLIGPLFLTFTLTRWSGKPLLEKGLAKTRPGYADYVARTSGFFPLPPRKGRAR